jgi:hypothetical protein
VDPAIGFNLCDGPFRSSQIFVYRLFEDTFVVAVDGRNFTSFLKCTVVQAGTKQYPF